jgi:hypothetical protein
MVKFRHVSAFDLRRELAAYQARSAESIALTTAMVSCSWQTIAQSRSLMAIADEILGRPGPFA